MTPNECCDFWKKSKITILALSEHSGIGQDGIAAFELGEEKLNLEMIEH